MGYTPPYLEVRKITGGWGIYGPSTVVGDDLWVYPNTTTTSPYVELLAGDSLKLFSPGYINLVPSNSSNSTLRLSYSTPDTILETITADKNIFLKTTGAGVLKFGTYAAGAATDSTGYITILDAAGNTRKLMVQA